MLLMFKLSTTNSTHEANVEIEYALNAVNQGITALGIKGLRCFQDP